MHLDRARFLALTALIAAATACPGPPAKTIAATSDAGTPIPSNGYASDAPADPYPIPLENFPGPTKESWGLYRPEVECFPLGPGPEKGGIRYDKQGLACVSAWACVGSDDLARPPPTCAELHARAGCVDADDGFRSPRAACERAKRFLKPRIAARFIGCMYDLADYACHRDLDDACREAALFRACPDMAIAEACHAIRTSCGTTPEAACTAYLSGLTDAGRDKVVSCMKFKSNCDAGMISCIDRLGAYD